MTRTFNQSDDNVDYIYCRYIVRGGKRIYPKNSSVFRIRVKRSNSK